MPPNFNDLLEYITHFTAKALPDGYNAALIMANDQVTFTIAKPDGGLVDPGPGHPTLTQHWLAAVEAAQLQAGLEPLSVADGGRYSWED